MEDVVEGTQRDLEKAAQLAWKLAREEIATHIREINRDTATKDSLRRILSAIDKCAKAIEAGNRALAFQEREEWYQTAMRSVQAKQARSGNA